MSRCRTPSGVGLSELSCMLPPIPCWLLLPIPCNFVILTYNFVTAAVEGHTMSGHLEIEDCGAVLLVRVDGGRHSLFGLEIANQLEEFVDRIDGDPTVRAVVFTGARPAR